MWAVSPDPAPQIYDVRQSSAGREQAVQNGVNRGEEAVTSRDFPTEIELTNLLVDFPRVG